MKNGDTPLILAVWNNENPAVFETLRAAGADLETQTKDGRTLLHLAAQNNDNPDVIKALLAAGAELEARDKYGNTPLHDAAENKNPDVIKALLAAGAKLEARDKYGNTPLHLAAQNNDNPDVIKALLAAGADLEARDKYGNTPLHDAAENKNPDVIKALLAAGAKLEARGKYGFKPLHEAAQSNENPAVIEALLEAGANPMAPNVGGKTPWDFAQDNEALKGSDAYWRLNEARFEVPGGGSRGSSKKGPAPAGNAGVTAGRAPCQIPGYPNPPGGVANLGFSWCPANVSLQVRAFALLAAGAQCAIATGSSSTPEQISARRREIKAACDRLAAWGEGNCQCPPSLRP